MKTAINKKIYGNCAYLEFHCLKIKYEEILEFINYDSFIKYIFKQNEKKLYRQKKSDEQDKRNFIINLKKIKKKLLCQI